MLERNGAPTKAKALPHTPRSQDPEGAKVVRAAVRNHSASPRRSPSTIAKPMVNVITMQTAKNVADTKMGLAASLTRTKSTPPAL
jgi:hypothetical protein